MAPTSRTRFISYAVACTGALATWMLMGTVEVTRRTASFRGGGRSRNVSERGDYGPEIVINPYARLPNEGRDEGEHSDLGNDVGTRSVYYGRHQEAHQIWLRRLSEQLVRGGDSDGRGRVSAMPEEAFIADGSDVPPKDRTGNGTAEGKAKEIGEVVGAPTVDERLYRLQKGEELWAATYVPPIAPEERERLVDRWTNASHAVDHGDMGTMTAGASRLLIVVTSFDRGKRLAKRYQGHVDKLDYTLMIADEARLACELGFSVHLHVIAAWDVSTEEKVFRDRLVCGERGSEVSFSTEEHSPSIKEVLSLKHRVYMKSRVEQFDVFVQLEDDMIFTTNHLLRYLEESETLAFRRLSTIPQVKPEFSFMPGFIRVEPSDKAIGGMANSTDEWFEWEIILSRIIGTKIKGAGVYLTLGKSKVLPSGGNNQGFWVATQAQVKYLHKKCGYLKYDDDSSYRHVEKYSGSLEMFAFCGTTKVFPAARFEDFLVHHRTNNKNGWRGESVPAVSVSMLRFWASQVVRDGSMMPEIDEGR